MKPLPGAYRLLPLVAVLSLSTAWPGCFAGDWFSGDLPALAYVAATGDNTHVWVTQPGAGEPVRISPRHSDARFPRWSPGQRFLAWVSGGTTTRLMVFDTETGDTQPLVSGIDASQPPVWAPASDRIAYVSDADGGPDLYTAALETGQKTRLTFSPEREQVGDWSPDGKWLVFTAAGREGLLLRNPNGVNLIALTNGPDSDPVWSPKGDRIAFLRAAGDGRDIYALRPTKSGNWADDTDAEVISNTDHDEFSPVWATDGRRLAFVVRHDGQSEIYTVRVDGSERRRLTQNTVDDLMPVWSQNGDKIAFVSHAYGNADILYMNQDGTEQMRLTTNDLADTQPDW